MTDKTNKFSFVKLLDDLKSKSSNTSSGVGNTSIGNEKKLKFEPNTNVTRHQGKKSIKLFS